MKFHLNKIIYKNMDLNTSYQDNVLTIEKEFEEIEKQKKFIETKLPENIDTHVVDSKNPFLDTTVRSLIDDFVLTWHKILIELLDVTKYKTIRRDEWWNFLQDLFLILKNVFWIKNRLFHIGLGFIIIAFFVFFILVTH
tara:strand:+ start:7663 stop:8079 length:417 start_codon:yes stop_codon:yes gene_type:complete